jgi:hypothetical protein
VVIVPVTHDALRIFTPQEEFNRLLKPCVDHPGELHVCDLLSQITSRSKGVRKPAAGSAPSSFVPSLVPSFGRRPLRCGQP